MMKIFKSTKPPGLKYLRLGWKGNKNTRNHDPNKIILKF